MSFDSVNVFQRWPVTEDNVALTGSKEQSVTGVGEYKLVCLSSFFVSFKNLGGIARIYEMYFIILNQKALARLFNSQTSIFVVP